MEKLDNLFFMIIWSSHAFKIKDKQFQIKSKSKLFYWGLIFFINPQSQAIFWKIFICYHLYYLKNILLTDYFSLFTSLKQTLSYTSLKQRNTTTTYKNSTCKMQRHSHLSNGFMEAERWINFFNFDCMFRKNGFREKTWTLWKQKELFMILFLGLSLNFL